VPYQYVYLRELLRHRRLGQFTREAWASRDVLKPLVKRRLSDRRRALPIEPLLAPAFYEGLEPPKFARAQDDLKRRLVADLQTFSLPSLLRYEDRNSMAFSMESRLPFPPGLGRLAAGRRRPSRPREAGPSARLRGVLTEGAPGGGSQVHPRDPVAAPAAPLGRSDPRVLCPCRGLPRPSATAGQDKVADLLAPSTPRSGCACSSNTAAPAVTPGDTRVGDAGGGARRRVGASRGPRHDQRHC
jgi:hypothetical protein